MIVMTNKNLFHALKVKINIVNIVYICRAPVGGASGEREATEKLYCNGVMIEVLIIFFFKYPKEKSSKKISEWCRGYRERKSTGVTL